MNVFDYPAKHALKWEEAVDVCPALVRKMDPVLTRLGRSTEWELGGVSFITGDEGTGSVTGTIVAKSANDHDRMIISFYWAANDITSHDQAHLLEATVNDKFEITHLADVLRVFAGTTGYSQVSTHSTTRKAITMAATKTTPVKKAPAKRPVAKKAPTSKAPAKKVPTKKAPVKKAAAKKAPGGRPALTDEQKAERLAERTAAREAREAAAVERRESREAARLAKRAEIVRLRDEGKTWKEIGEALNMFDGTAIVEYNIANRTEPVQEPTPAKVKKDRDSEGMSWMQMIVKYDTSIAKLQKLYREAGGNPRTSDIGKGGRWVERDPNRPKPVKAKKAPKETTELTYVFNGDEESDAITKRLTGKNVTWEMSRMPGRTDSAKVKSVSAIGKAKSGERSVSFIDAATGSKRTIALAKIVKVGGRA